MKKNLTELVFILDMSGSMYPMAEATIRGFNSLLSKQRELDGDAFINTYLFNTKTVMLHDRTTPSETEDMTADDYHACGCTALVDAVGSTVQHIGNIRKYIRKEDVPERTLFVIVTDGAENSSSSYCASEVKPMVKKHIADDGWDFLFIGANIDAAATAGFLGIDAAHSVNYNCDSDGTALVFSAISDACTKVRQGKRLTRNWKRKVNEDYQNRRTDNEF